MPAKKKTTSPPVTSPWFPELPIEDQYKLRNYLANTIGNLSAAMTASMTSVQLLAPDSFLFDEIAEIDRLRLVLKAKLAELGPKHKPVKKEPVAY